MFQHKKSVMYDSDRRLTMQIVESMPRIQISNPEKDTLPSKMIAGEIMELNLQLKNVGNIDARNVWFNSNQGHNLRIESQDLMDFRSSRLIMSSLPGPISVGDIEAGESKILKTKLLMQKQPHTLHSPCDVGQNLIEIMVYCQDDQNEQFIPQTDSITLETLIVAPMALQANILPAPIHCHKRALQGM